MQLNYESCDETKFSYISHPNKRNYGKNRICGEIFFSLICRGVLNVSQIIRLTDEESISIPINPENVDEKLSFEEILADISLAELLSGDSGDRSLIPGNDKKNGNGENISGNNLRIYPIGVYSLFDFEDINLWNAKDIELLSALYDNIKNLYSSGQLIIPNSYFIESGYLRDIYGTRILKIVNKFLEIYDNEEGKKLFITQLFYSINSEFCTKEKVDNILQKKDILDWSFGCNFDVEGSYNNFIDLLKNLKNIFENDNSALDNYIRTPESLEKNYVTIIRELLKGFRFFRKGKLTKKD